MTESSENRVSVQDASVHYGDFCAVERVSLQVKAGQVHVLLGRSGSGKTTLLRAIAGFEKLTEGSISLAGQVVDAPATQVWSPPEKRQIGFVFQDYALFPHLDAGGNIAFGTKGRDAKAAVAKTWLERVQLPGHAGKRPGELSGGEQQRIALARALANAPGLVLLDEPFSNLDSHLRRSVREETMSLLRENGATAVFVTHDAEEAFSIADQVSVLHNGKLEQTGTPQELYLRPASVHVARLCGPANLLPFEAAEDGFVECVLGRIAATGAAKGAGVLVLRPDQIRLVPDDDGNARVTARRFLGHTEELELDVGGQQLLARVAPDSVPDASRLALSVPGPVHAISTSA